MTMAGGIVRTGRDIGGEEVDLERGRVVVDGDERVGGQVI